MKRSDLEHILRASRSVTGETEFIVIGWCLDPHDLAISKLAAGREKDLAFVGALLRLKMVRTGRLQELIQLLGDSELRARITDALKICHRR
jgi:hypothetical protein